MAIKTKPLPIWAAAPSANQQQQLTWNGGALPRPRLNLVLPVPEIDWSYAVIERLNPQTLATSLVPFNPGKLVQQHEASQDLTLEPGDVVTIFSQVDISVPQDQRTKFVRLEGEFASAGIYSVAPGETLRQLVSRAGGLTAQCISLRFRIHPRVHARAFSNSD